MYSKESAALRQKFIDLITELKSRQGVDFTDGYLVNEFAKLVYRQWPDIDTQNEMFKIMQGPVSYQTSSTKPPVGMKEYQGKNSKKKERIVADSGIIHTESVVTKEVPSTLQEDPSYEEPKDVTVKDLEGLDANGLIEVFGSVGAVLEYAVNTLGIKFEKEPTMLKLAQSIKKHIKEKVQEEIIK